MVAGLVLSGVASDNIQGLPFTRFYSYEEIGNVSRGAQLGFDALGRVTVMRSGSYSVLNDTTWVDIAEKVDGPTMQRVFTGPDGQAYYGSFGSFGLVDTNARGLLRPRSLLPADYPKWVKSANFYEAIVTNTGVYFASFGGVVHWTRATGKLAYFEIAEVSRIFSAGGDVFAATHTGGILRLDLAHHSLHRVGDPTPVQQFVDQVTPLREGVALIATVDGRFVLFDGQRFTPWSGPLAEHPTGRVTALHRLPEGSVAVAINGRGLYIVAADGRIISSYNTPEYHLITDLAARESGVLWIATEGGIEKVLYESPLTSFGQRLGLPISWPQIVRWKDRYVVASGGRLYETVTAAHADPSQPIATNRFQLMPNQPSPEVWGLAARGDHLLIGNALGVLARGPDDRFVPVLTDINVARLVMVNDALCYVIGQGEIAVLRRDEGRWTEAAPRVAGLGYPAIVHASRESAWIELGANRAARVHLRDGRLETYVFENYPWTEPKWINIGIVGDTVVLSGMPNGRLYFDEKAEKLVDEPRLRKLFDQAPQPITRVREDENGTIWATHDQGLLMIQPEGDAFHISPVTYGKISDRFPTLQLLPGGDVWLTTGQSLYHLDRNVSLSNPPRFKPTLVSVVNGRTNRELLTPQSADRALPTLAYAENSLILRFFAGTYASRQPPAYDFRLHRGGTSWEVVGNGSVLTLTDLREGAYRLEVRVTDSREPIGETLFLPFEIAPPWYRTWYAYALYALGAGAAVFGLMRWSVHHARSRNVALEKLVAERTNELRFAMQQLNEETRTSATLAERDRLAGEIHDSLQQGLSGLMLHLDATLKLPDLPADVRSRLSIARNMVSFTRHEVQHAVWDMETPLLADTELGDALRKIASLIDPGAARVQITVSGRLVELSPSTKHHLMRIGQEAITNAVRHAAATTIAVHLAYESHAVSLSVSDDGNGFVPGEVLTKGLGHFGLRGLRGRAAKIGGELTIESAPGRGTTVCIVVPLTAPAYVHGR
ncbi:MAG TPA: sensor histidine kinase [Lacunisphaera sp.]|nr:sensor histidine kinase [Lacunisphaera sp.]